MASESSESMTYSTFGLMELMGYGIRAHLAIVKYLQNALSIHYLTQCRFFWLQCTCSVKDSEKHFMGGGPLKQKF